jgi:hypothetical protein
MNMSLASRVEAIKKQPLTNEERDALQEFQRIYQVDDEDPLGVVLALMFRSQMILESAPSQLQQKVMETIELHRTNLREQATITAKELISDVASAVLGHQRSLTDIWSIRLRWGGGGAAGGLIVGVALACVVFKLAHTFT